jgi:hypothetical protein
MREWREDRSEKVRLDELLDNALASYCQAPETEGLERRVLAKVNERARRRPAGRFAMALAAAAALCWLLWWEMPKTAMHPPASKTTKPTEALLARTTPARDPVVVLPHANKKSGKPRRPAEPKLAQFPAPSPMSSEERALLRLVTGDPKNIPRELTHSGNPIEPLQIAAIEIKPLE